MSHIEKETSFSVNGDLELFAGPIVGSFVLHETTRAGEEEVPEHIRSAWNDISLPVRPMMAPFYERNEVEVFVYDALTALRVQKGAEHPAFAYWKEEIPSLGRIRSGKLGFGLTFGFDLDQGKVKYFDDFPRLSTSIFKGFKAIHCDSD